MEIRLKSRPLGLLEMRPQLFVQNRHFSFRQLQRNSIPKKIVQQTLKSSAYSNKQVSENQDNMKNTGPRLL